MPQVSEITLPPLIGYGLPTGWEGQSETMGERYQEAVKAILAAVERSEYWRTFGHAEAQLRNLSGLKPGWDSYGADIPNKRSMSAASRILSALRSLNLPPTRVVPSSEGGVSFCFVQGEAYADIECLNSGEILAAAYRGTLEPHVWELQLDEHSITRTVQEIRAHLTS